MPEGHTIHRLARDQAPDLAGHPLRLTAEQGLRTGQPRAAQALRAARALDGLTLRGIEPYGKHLRYRFEGTDDALHVHLGLFGRFRRFPAPGPEPRPTDRLLLAGPDHVWRLAGATTSQLVTAPEWDAVLARLGPDPLRPDADPERFGAALRRRRAPIAAALTDQAVVAGVGNMFRAEVLWALRLPPHMPAREVPDAGVLWAEVAAQLRRGLERGRWRRGIYRQTACRRCGGPVATEQLALRTLWWCPVCQAA